MAVWVVAGDTVEGGGVSSMTITSRTLPELSTSWTSLYVTVNCCRLRLRAVTGGVGMAPMLLGGGRWDGWENWGSIWGARACTAACIGSVCAGGGGGLGEREGRSYQTDIAQSSFE